MISCNQHDYIEIACMYRYPVKLILKSGFEVVGVACDTQLNYQKEECIQLICGEKKQLFALDSLVKLIVQKVNPHFDQIELD